MQLSSRLFVSFSGGETSAMMAVWVKENLAVAYDEVVFLMANTGEENERTLDFAQRCDDHFKLGLVLVEAVIHHGVRKNPTARVVSFAEASRHGEPFEEMIKKYGIPNSKAKHCTRALKLRPMEDYVHNTLGWARGSYDTAIGIRADEMDRISSQQFERKIIYPFISFEPTTKPEVNAFWRAQPFRLGLKGYEGNCKWCWKKSFRKHYTILRENPAAYDFPQLMEANYGMVGAEFLKDTSERRDPLPEGYRRVFFRESKSVLDLKREALALPSSFVPAPDDANVYPDFDPDLDAGAGCEESCEVHADEDQETEE